MRWLVLFALVAAASATFGDAHAGEVVDGAVFVVLFLSTLRRYDAVGAGASLYAPAVLVTLGMAFRSYAIDGEHVRSVFLFVHFIRFAVIALLLLLVLALTARAGPIRRTYNCVVVGACAWGIGGLFILACGVPTGVSSLRHLFASGLFGAAAGWYCVIVGGGFATNRLAARGSSRSATPEERIR